MMRVKDVPDADGGIELLATCCSTFLRFVGAMIQFRNSDWIPCGLHSLE